MPDFPRSTLPRRVVLRSLAIPTVSMVAWALREFRIGAPPIHEATACVDDMPTPAATEGPYFKPGSPERGNLLDFGARGTLLILSGRVLAAGCVPIAGARVDLWQADPSGAYDNAGQKLRGHVVTDASGTYRFLTVIPGLYTGRTRHIHIKVEAPGEPPLTTQLYFPNEPGNETDRLFDPALVLAVTNAAGGYAADFDLVLADA